MASSTVSPYYAALMTLKPEGLTEAAWARVAGVSSSFFQDMKKKATKPKHDNLVKVLEAAGISMDQFTRALQGDTDAGPAEPTIIGSVRAADIPFRHRSNPTDVPVYGTAEGARLHLNHEQEMDVETTTMMPDDVVDYLRRPIGIAARRNIYALFVVGTSMEPRYLDGEPIFVDPTRAPAIGDHVVLQLCERVGEGDGMVVRAMVKRLVRRTADAYELEQYEPRKIFRIARDEVAAIHRVIPPSELHGI